MSTAAAAPPAAASSLTHTTPPTHHTPSVAPSLSAAATAATTATAATAAAAAAASSATHALRKGDLRQALLDAILSERARKAKRIAQGLPDTESSDDDSDSDDEPTANGSATSRRASASRRAPPVRTKSDYGVTRYWNDRYSKTSGLFDWYVDEEHLLPLIDEVGERAYHAISRTSVTDSDPQSLPSLPASFRSSLRLLDVGCGNSGLGAALYHRGWLHQTHIDVSDVIISRMSDLYRDAPSHYGEWLSMDAAHMSFPDASFDVLVEKGTIDALDCTPEEQRICYNILKECSRVLKPGGVLLVVTHGGPRRRLPLLQQGEFNWRVETRALAYSESALLIRHMRSQLQGLPLSGATPALKAQCSEAVRATRAGMAEEMKRAQACIARVEAELAAHAATAAASAGPDDDPAPLPVANAALLQEEADTLSPSASNICFAYVCTKLHTAAAGEPARAAAPS